ncbi:unnamed protein product [Orchesella dallaii]|uniref:Uncharacterized protein n=1 Tax=Orchesella dallaii TaxID=48710 RepID=A0ABP1QZR6_9HEXA
MIFLEILSLFALLYPSSVLATSVFPITFNTNCFVRIVHERNLNSTTLHPAKISLPLETQTTSDTTISYMIQDLSHFSFAFDIDDIYINDQVTILDGYFPFFSKHYKTCDVFILLTESFNSTATAIQESGYGASEAATFLVLVDCCNGSIMDNNILAGFLSDLGSLETASFSPIYSNLAFVAIPEVNTKSQTTRITSVYAYCYYCPEKLHKIHVPLSNNKPHSLSMREIGSKCEELNNNGWNRKVLILATGPANSYEGLITNIDHKIEKERKSFTQHLKESYIAEYLLFRMASHQINMTIDSNLRRYLADDEPETHWYLSIKAIRTFVPEFRNDITASRGTYIVTHQETLTMLYCMEISELVKIKWDIYFTVLDFPSWLCILLVLLGYCFIYKNFSQGIDLAWILLDMEFWKRHPRKILAPYFLGAVFLHWVYDSGMSTDFIDFDYPVYFKEVGDKGYRIWDSDISPGLEDFDQIKDFIPNSVRKFVQENAGFRDFNKVFYMENGYHLPENFRDCFKAAVDKKLVFINGAENSYTFPSLFMTLSVMKMAVVEEKFLCGILNQYPTSNFQLYHSFLFRGFMSRKFVNRLESFLRAGLLEYLQGLINLQSALKVRPRIDDVNAVLSSSTLGVRTPLVIVCGSYMALSCVFLLVFIGSSIYEHGEKATARIREMYESMLRNPGSKKRIRINVQVMREGSSN